MPASVSVIIPSFNCAAWIGRAIESIAAQSYPVQEITVVDDGSTDNLREVLPPSIRYVRQEQNRGPSAARNSGARVASGDYLFFLDADDTLAPDAIGKMMDAVEGSASSWCITDTLQLGPIRNGTRACVPACDDPLLAILTYDFVQSGCFFRRADFAEVGGYDETLRAREDWDLNIRMIEAGKRFRHLAEPLYEYRWRENSITHANWDIMLSSSERVLAKHHRRLRSRGRAFEVAYAEALWHLGRWYWDAMQRGQGLRCAMQSMLLARSPRRAFGALDRLMWWRPVFPE